MAQRHLPVSLIRQAVQVVNEPRDIGLSRFQQFVVAREDVQGKIDGVKPHRPPATDTRPEELAANEGMRERELLQTRLLFATDRMTFTEPAHQRQHRACVCGLLRCQHRLFEQRHQRDRGERAEPGELLRYSGLAELGGEMRLGAQECHEPIQKGAGVLGL